MRPSAVRHRTGQRRSVRAPVPGSGCTRRRAPRCRPLSCSVFPVEPAREQARDYRVCGVVAYERLDCGVTRLVVAARSRGTVQGRRALLRNGAYRMQWKAPIQPGHIVIVLSAALAPGWASAAGFALMEQSGSGTGVAYAGIAASGDDPSV